MSKKFLAMLMACILLVSTATSVMADDIGNDACVQVEESDEDEPPDVIKEPEIYPELLKPVDKGAMLLSTEGEIGVLSGRVSLADDATVNGGRIGVDVYKFEKTNGKITARSVVSVAYKSYQLVNNHYVDYSFTLPKGSYAVSAEYYYGIGDAVGYPMYYAASKSVNSVYGADSIALEDSAVADIVISKAERVIKGTITFESAMTEDTGFYVMASDNNYTVDGYNYLPVSRGTTSVEYSVGVGVGTYNLNMGVDGYNYGYYSIYDTVDDWKNVCYIDTTSENLADVDFNYAAGSGRAVMPVTVKLPNAVSADKIYRAGYISGNTTTSSGNAMVSSGESEFETELNVTNTKNGYVFIADATISNSVYSQEYSGFYYYSEEFGITSDLDKATLVDFEKTEALTITFPESVTLSGTVIRNGNAVGESIEFSVRADVEGESFYKTVRIEKDADSAEYSLDIPKTYEGKTAQVYLVLKERETTRELLTIGDTHNVTVAWDMETINLSVPDGLFVETSGIFKLSAPAPAGGVKATLSSRFKKGNTTISYRNADFNIPEGQDELAYSTYILNCDGTKSNGNINVQISTTSTDYSFDNYKNISVDPANATNMEIALVYNNQTLSGKVILPQDITVSTASTYRISASYTYAGASYYEDAYVSVKKNTREAEYCIYLPKGAVITNLSMYTENIGDCCVEGNTLYYTGSGTSKDYTNISVVADNPVSVNFRPQKAKLIRGTVTVPDDFTGSAYAWVYARGTSVTYVQINSPGEIKYTTSVPLDTASTTVYLSFSDQYVCNYFTGNTYYNSNGSKYISSEAETIALSTDLTDNINFTLIEAAVLTGTLTYGEGATYEGSGSLRVYAQGTNFSNSAHLNLTSLEDFDYSISVPKVEAESVYVYAELSLYSGTASNMSAGKYYYKGEQTLSVLESDKQAVNLNNVSKIDMTIPTGYRISGKIVYPDGAIGKLEKGNLYASYKDGTTTRNISSYIVPDENGNYEAYLPPIPRTYTFYLNPTMSSKTNLIGSTYYYVSANSSAMSNSSATSVDISGGKADINFIIEKGSTISGKIILPDGVEYSSGMSASLCLQKSSPYLYQYGNVALTGRETEYMIAYPTSAGNGVYMRYTCYTSPIYSDFLYYTGKTPTTDEASAALLDAGATNVDLKLAKQGGEVKIKPYRDAGSSGYVGYKIKIMTDAGVVVTTTNNSMSGTATEGSEKTIKLPDFGRTATKFKLGFIINNKVGYYMTETMYSPESDEGTWINISNITFRAKLPDMNNLVSMGDILVDGIKSGAVSVGVSEAVADSSSDELNVSFDCKNNAQIPLVSNIYVGVYKNNVLLEVVPYKYEIPQSSTEGSVDVSIPMDISGEYEYKLYMWDGLSKRRPVTSSVEAEVK